MTSRLPHSSHWGAFTAEVHDGRLVGVLPRPGDPEPSPLLSGIADALHADVRVAAPAVRRGWLEQGPGATSERRGADDFVEVGWDRALDLVAAELDRVRREHGNPAIFGGSYGWASAGRFHHAKTQLARFLNLFGGCTDQKYNYSYAAASAILPHVVGTGGPTAGEVTSWDVIAEHTRLWVMFGGAPLKNAQVESGGITRHSAAHWLRAARDNGTRFVAVTPIRDDVAGFLDAAWLPVRPNTDTAVMLGLAHTLLVEDRYDRDFVARYCVGFDRFRRYLEGADDGRPKSAEWAAAIAGIDAGALRDLARRMVAERTMITSTWSLQRADHGEQPFWMTVVLAAMVGQIGLPGGGFGFAYGDTAGMGNRRYPFPAPALPAGVNPAGSTIPVARIADMLLHPGEPYDFDGERRRYPDIRLVYWAGGNPFHHHQDLNRLLRGWRRPETVVVHEPWWTATARHADIVLPATTTLERNDIGASSRDDAIVAMHQAVEPVGQARHDFDILAGLAGRLGFRDAFTEGRDEAAWLRHLYERSRRAAARNGAELPEFDEFWARGHADVPGTRSFVLFEAFRSDPAAHPLRTPSGRIEIFSATIEGFGYDDCPPHPTWLEPAEWLGAAQAARHPLHLISNQPRTRLHGQLDMGRVSRDSKVNGREPCRLNPSDAAARAIRDGDLIRLFNDRGACLAGAVLTDAVRPGVVELATGAWYDPREPGTVGALDLHGNPNVLTADHGTSRLGQGPSAHSALVQAERFDGDAPPVAVLRVTPVSDEGKTDGADGS
ncbi:molybdopterin guanine dinucleotide-containing S/N-oxide reductase [Phytohabitans sp. ZYX-F-186]|uniref:Molybdopterin guanine dinucleotide-containing S/N-oxide reductase n=1 Tax=Phytohabitans maris TaxID=3071409 RepID=A0ABU0ZLZ0_9ACTN|nr:molybdopterin guanine dinucleotide-containing S/N-oxide reductase [Phytohabitans sp. ZYX-F-186]MDQ7908020.1 molybdopterin guanine dinucleotide-containing S/N-oxide reductase [Phytohabitans sp. ZYX-F-186]